MRLYPETASTQLEFDKIKGLLVSYCSSQAAGQMAESLRIHTRVDIIERCLQQSYEYKLIQEAGQYFPNDYILNIQRELKMLGIEGAVLLGDQWVLIRKLAESIKAIFHWFDSERRLAYPALSLVIEGNYYEKEILKLIDGVVDPYGQAMDKASEELFRIRVTLSRRRNELRRVFEKVLQRYAKAGYVTDTEEAFLNGRRVVALFAEHKRQIKGILHGESDSRKTVYMEPEDTIELNNEVFMLENDERKEVHRILKELTARISVHSSLLESYFSILTEFDFIRAKAKLAIEYGGNLPMLTAKAHVQLKDAYHPLLYIYNRRQGKPTIPVNLTLDEKQRILVISGPNAGGKTVTLKTIGLLQMMVQSGLLVPVDPHSQFGLFKQLMIHIGDTQSIEFDLSTYSSHLQHMKYFMENANGRTLFFIDELGSGSDPSLGGAFAEVILDELSRKHALGIVTTHYLNLKVMASKTPGIFNGAMAFDEKNLMPKYKLLIGKPGSSYTFAIAERIGLDKRLIDRARKLVDDEHFQLDKLLNKAEQDVQHLEQREKELHRLLKENERLKKEMTQVMDKERHRQQVELLKQQNQVTEDKLVYLRETERKLKQIVSDWKRVEDKEDKKELIKQIQLLLFQQKEKQVQEKRQKKLDKRFLETGEPVIVGTKVYMEKNRQVGIVKEIRGKNAVVQVGLMPLTVSLESLKAIIEKEVEDPTTKK